LRPGDPIPLGDDDFVQVSLPFTFSFCGLDYDAVFINSNGSLSFGSGSTDFSESAGEFLTGPPRIAPLWIDLAPNMGGTVVFNQTANDFTVAFTNVPEFPTVGANTFSVVLHRSSNQIDFTYGGVTATRGLTGLSCGGRVTTSFEPEVDLSARIVPNQTINSRSAPAIYELFTGDNDLDNLALFFNAPNAFKDTGEPNNTPGKATRVNSLPYSSIDRYTAIEPVGNDIDFFRVGLTAGTTFTAEIVGGRLDSLVGLFDAAGNLLAADDDSGAGLLSKLSYAVATSGNYFVAVTTYPDLSFTGAGGDGGRYVLNMSAVVGTILTLGDDASVQVSLPFAFPFDGASYTSVFVNSNGNLTFGIGSTDFSESVPEFLSGPPRIAPLWDDLDPSSGGTISVTQTASTWKVEFSGVPEFFSPTGNTFSVTLTAAGEIDIAYGSTAGNDGLVGVTPGGGAADPGETDLSAAGALSATGTTYEQFGTGELDLSTLLLMFLP
ncbi:MAG TPA: hypothetical protein VFQ07_17445, partial [Candidatus Polarisedimenticolia bacterium]|nr:hypothetical protein [Candidatus Polarisedimenticolia bacterium]